MEQLDLKQHSPEEYSGKLIVSHGAEYIVGPHLGTGAERIVHLLVNRRSQLALLVIKIMRQALPKGLLSSIYAKLRSDPKLAEVVTVTHGIDLPGGHAELQPYVGGGDVGADPEDAALDAAYQALKGDDLSGAAAQYEALLARRPDHTIALINLASARSGLGEASRAAELARRAVEIEPNLLLYREALIQYTAAASMIPLAIEEFVAATSVFENVFDLHELAIDLYLACGNPEAAQPLIDQAIVDADARAALRARVDEALAAAAAATDLLGEVQGCVERKQWDQALDLLTRANKTYNKEAAVNINFALALARAGEYEAAAGLLMASSLLINDHRGPLCTANAAFSLVRSGRVEMALSMLDQLAHILTILNGGQLPSHMADLPGVAIWLDPDEWMEEPIQSAVGLIEQAVAASASPPPSVIALLDAYRQASRD